MFKNSFNFKDFNLSKSCTFEPIIMDPKYVDIEFFYSKVKFPNISKSKKKVYQYLVKLLHKNQIKEVNFWLNYTT